MKQLAGADRRRLIPMAAVLLSAVALIFGSPNLLANPKNANSVQRPTKTRVQKLPLSVLAGRVLVPAYSGTSALKLVRRGHFGGVIVMSDNVGSFSRLRQENHKLAKFFRRIKQPGLIAIDQEGGTVARLGYPATQLPAFMAAGAAQHSIATQKMTQAAGAELRYLGFNTVFAPVADVVLDSSNPIGTRAVSSDANLVKTQVAAANSGYLNAGIMPVLKHFPGLGAAKADSHFVTPVVRSSVAKMLARDLVPYRHLFAKKLAPAVMTAHIVLPKIDPKLPASISAPITTGLLRKRLSYQGLVITDSFQMRGLTSRMGPNRAVVQAIRAGADLVLMPPDPFAAKAAIIRAVRHGYLSRTKLEIAVSRTWRVLGERSTRSRGLRPGSAQAAANRLMTAAVTSVAGPCKGRLLANRIKISGPKFAVQAFADLAREAGIKLAKKRAQRVALVFAGAIPAKADVVIALNSPNLLARTSARVRIATFSSSKSALNIAIRVLLGRQSAPGKLPVPVAGVPRRGC